jgi:hypothetical protein
MCVIGICAQYIGSGPPTSTRIFGNFITKFGEDPITNGWFGLMVKPSAKMAEVRGSIPHDPWHIRWWLVLTHGIYILYIVYSVTIYYIY